MKRWLALSPVSTATIKSKLFEIKKYFKICICFLTSRGNYFRAEKTPYLWYPDLVRTIFSLQLFSRYSYCSEPNSLSFKIYLKTTTCNLNTSKQSNTFKKSSLVSVVSKFSFSCSQYFRNKSVLSSAVTFVNSSSLNKDWYSSTGIKE